VIAAWHHGGRLHWRASQGRPFQALDFEVLTMIAWVPAAIPAFFAFAIVGYGLMQAYG
jgi:hypothetical protein